MSDLTPNHNPGEPLQPIDKEGLAKLAQKNIDNPEGGRKTVRTHTEADGQFRNYTKVRGLDPVLVSVFSSQTRGPRLDTTNVASFNPAY